MAYQLEFGEERALRELFMRYGFWEKGPKAELRRAYDALAELSVGSNTAASQALEEYKKMYLKCFELYSRGDFQRAEQMARVIKHLARATWYDSKIKFLEGHSEDLPHLPGLNEGGLRGIEQGLAEIESRLSRLKLTGDKDRFGGRARKHLERIRALPDKNTLIADTFLKAAHEYCLATESLYELDFQLAA